MLNKLILGLICTLSCASTCFAGQESQASTMSEQVDYNNKKPKITDMELTKKIQDKISSGWFSKGFDNVTVSVTDGAVTLDGTVDSVEDHKKLLDEIKSMDGVKSVRSNLVVKK